MITVVSLAKTYWSPQLYNQSDEAILILPHDCKLLNGSVAPSNIIKVFGLLGLYQRLGKKSVKIRIFSS